MSDDLITWLRAQLDEDEDTARRAGRDRWKATGLAFVDDSSGHAVVCDESMSSGVQAHIALHDPARVLAEVEAKRRILDDCAGYVDEAAVTDGLSSRVPKLLALPYADRPGYREEWRP